MIEILLDDGHIWLRIARPHYGDPLDPSHAQERGGRWNPPRSWPTLYLNRDLSTVHAQVRHLFVDRGVDPDELADDAPIHLAAATLPEAQRVANVVSAEGVATVGLPTAYPLDEDGSLVSHEMTQPIGEQIHEAGLRGALCRSAATPDGFGQELAWFPATGERAHAVWPKPLGFGRWRHARSLADIRASQPPRVR